MARFIALFKKDQGTIGSDYDWLAAPSIVMVNVTLTDVDGLMDSESVIESADIIWKYSDMKKEVLEKKVNPGNVVDELLSSLTTSGGSSANHNESDDDEGEETLIPKAVKEQTVWIKKEANPMPGFTDVGEAVGDHTQIEDDWDFVASLDESPEYPEADLEGLGEDQLL